MSYTSASAFVKAVSFFNSTVSYGAKRHQPSVISRNQTLQIPLSFRSKLRQLTENKYGWLFGREYCFGTPGAFPVL
jgi:hypothetical protein